MKNKVNNGMSQVKVTSDGKPLREVKAIVNGKPYFGKT